jgi:hypothetical protein
VHHAETVSQIAAEHLDASGPAAGRQPRPPARTKSTIRLPA